ncbi:MAG: WD40/YVTN/BNR-like repeat-containing protein [Planctomycetota bacterium]
MYAIIEAADDKQGVYRSTDRGSTWNKMTSWVSSSPQYYNELVCHPHDEDTVYFLETFLRVTHDGGETIERVPIDDKHVDDHALWIDPTDTRHMINGCDGGIYETWDSGENWDFKANLPVTQFYKIGIDNSEPFYYVYGGTQDNNTQGGPTQTIDIAGIANEDWFITVGGDGFEVVIDPLDPNLVYCQWQYGGLTRFDRASGEQVDIRPIEAPGEEPYVFNWDAGLMISPHLNTRLYFGADRLFRSDDRGDSWRAVSPDLTRRLDRNQLEVMGVIQKPDAVAKHVSTSIYGNIVAIAESPFVEGLLYVGSDDGQISISEDGGANWRAEVEFPGVPDLSYVAYLTASQHDADTIFAAFDNHKSGDFTPYLLRSDDRGRTWASIAGDLPEDDVVYAIQQDHIDPDLLFCGTEYGAYYTVDGGENWVKFKGIPTVAIRDLELQRRENDVVAGSFGRGFYVLDDYTALRNFDESVLEREAHMFPIPEAEAYIMTSRLGMNTGRGFQGASWYSAANPPFGATITFFVKDKPKTIAEQREESEKEEGWEYPTIDEFRAEDTEQEPQFYMEISDASGNPIRRIDLPREEGVQRATWDLRYRSSSPISLRSPTAPMWAPPNAGPMVVPGEYAASIWLEDEGETSLIAGPERFSVRALELATLTDEAKEESLEFYLRAVELHQAVLGANRYRSSLNDRMEHVRRALIETRGADVSLLNEMEELRRAMIGVRNDMSGDPTLGRRSEPAPTSISSRLSSVLSDVYVTSPPTRTHREQYGHAGEQFTDVLETLRDVTARLAEIEAHLDEVKAPWTPGRLPTWDGPIRP